MANRNYNHGSAPIFNSLGSSAVMRAEFDAVSSGFSGIEGEVDVVSAGLAAHVGNISNPHSVTKLQVGLGDCDNTSDADKPLSSAAISRFSALTASDIGYGPITVADKLDELISGSTLISMTSANVTLTPLQYGKPIIVITGTLTTNLNLIFPAIVGKWLIVNSTTGSYTITCKTASGAGVVANQGDASNIYGDATNINDSLGFQGANQSLGVNGYQKLPGGLILQWGSGNTGVTGTVSIAFPLEFPGGPYQIMATDFSSQNLNLNIVGCDNGTKTGFTASSTANGSWAASNTDFKWFAIGH